MELMLTVTVGLLLVCVYEFSTNRINCKRENIHFSKRRAIQSFDEKLANGMGTKLKAQIHK